MTNPPLVLVASPNLREEDCACPDKAFVLAFDDQANAFPEGQCDCACPNTAFPLAWEQPASHPFHQAPDTHLAALPHGFWLAFSPYAPAGPAVLNAEAWERWQAFHAPQSLTQPVDRELVAQRLLLPHGRPPQPAAASPETLTAWLHVTNACNLDCPYCYVRKSSEMMSAAIGLEAVEAIFRTALKHGFRRVKLKYAGGEATLHFRLLRQLHHRAVQLAEETGLSLTEVVLSNGVHLRHEDAQWLRDEGIKLMISLDGVGELHDRLRPLKKGGATFERVAHTIDAIILPLGMRPDISMTVTGVNAHGAADVARWALLERDLPLSFNFYRQNLLSATRAELALEETAIIDGLLAAYAVIETNLPTRPFFNGLLDRVQAEAHAHTCGVGLSYMVITHIGQLAQCQMHLDQPAAPNLIGELLPILAAAPIQNLSVDQKNGCRSCEYRYRCSGGCPLETYRATGRWDVQSPNCNIYKTLLPAALRLEGLRLMKTHGFLS